MGIGSLFDTHVVVDWSARSKPSPKRPTKDAIWWAMARDGKVRRPQYCRTRQEAVKGLRKLLTDEMKAKRRVLVGFDFPFGYPKGVAERLTGRVSAFGVWDWLACRIEDRADNGNNRYAVAEEINRHFPGVGPCWGRPANWPYPDVPTRARDRTCQEPHPLERRISDKRADGAKTLWQLAYAGSVGSQALLGIAALARLIRCPGVEDHVSVWPLGTGLRLPDSPIVFAEVYPSLIREAVVARRERGEILDRAQVRINALAFSRLDSNGELLALFGGAPNLTLEERRIVEVEEAWMLGLGHADALMKALAT